MARDSNAKPVHILHIGRVETAYQAMWEQLQRDGISVAFARTQRSGLQMAIDLQPQVVVVQTAANHFSADRLCRALGRRLPSVQRLLISEAGASSEAPCELRLVRPFTVRKQRESMLKLLAAAAPHVIRAGSLQLDPVARVITSPVGQQRVTPKECSLLAMLMQHPNQVLSRKDIMERVWNTTYLGDTRTLEVHVRWLREKIEPEPTRPTTLLTRRGVGYMLSVPELLLDSADPSEDL